VSINRPTVIDLFAGAGGLSLGLEQAGFESVFVSELNPDAMETYLKNRDGASRFDLRESKRSVGDITTITRDSHALKSVARSLKKQHGDITLLVGGPPCQGYSGIGHRRSFDLAKQEVPGNHLYLDMAAVISTVQPRMFLFENVRGLLTSRWSKQGGDKGEIWNDVQAAFRRIGESSGERGYQMHSALIRAKDYGVAQNRPRILLVGVRDDISPTIVDTGIANGFLPFPNGAAPDLVDLLSDLIDPKFEDLFSHETLIYPNDAMNELQSRLREGAHGRGSGSRKQGQLVTEMQYSRHSERVKKKFEYMLANEGRIHSDHQTKKFAQKLLPAIWPASGPSITATSLPDDYVHFSQPRTLTVREWARLQMFPDWYQFAGKRTTGGQRRAGNPLLNNWDREAPKYTQIGNAVPVELGRQLGLHLLALAG